MCEEIQNRNRSLLVDLLAKYNIGKSLKDLTDYESVFLSIEFMKTEVINTEFKRVILYGNLKYAVENGTLVKTNKKVILYNFGKKLIKKMSDTEVDKVIAELKLISSLTKQLKLVTKIELEESDIQSILSDFDIKGT